MSVGDRNVGAAGQHSRVETPRPETPAREAEVGPVVTRGRYQGMEVEVIADPHSSILDSAEELTFSLADTVERKIFDRKVSKREAAVVSPAEVEKAELTAKKLRGIRPEDLKRMLKSIRENRPGDASELARMARHAFPDPTERHRALEYVRDAVAEAGGDAEMVALIDTAIIALEAEDGAAIRAGYNINDVPLTDLADAAGHREAYRDNVLSFRNAADSFSQMLREYGDDGVGTMLGYISQSLAADMESLTPSTEAERLAAVNDGIATARSLAVVHDDMAALAKSTGVATGVGVVGKASNALFATMSGEVKSSYDLKARLPLTGRANPTRDVEFLSGFMQIARNLPDRLFANGAARQGMIDLIQGALDESIALEEAVLDGLE
ncbi:MAG: type III secretion system gatekeeper subunit SctW [Planctomycetaceae bacterium]|nr:type III secretion system gatekeeper subunit SctW [Planctomycetaceae bacterium]